MQSEEFDKKIREAASHHHPPYDEKAWGKMHKLLDKHLPEKKDDRRRFLFFLLLFFLTGTGILLLMGKQTKQISGPVSQQKIEKNIIQKKDEKIKEEGDNRKQNDELIQPDKRLPGVINDENKLTNPDKTGNKVTERNFKSSEGVKSLFQPPDNKNAFASGLGNKKRAEINSVEKNYPNYNQQKKSLITEQPKDNQQVSINKNEVPAVQYNNSNQLPSQPATETKEELALVNKSLNADTGSLTSGIENDLKKQDKKQPAKKTKSNRRNFFFISLSAAPDISYTKGGSLGTTRLISGISLGYTFKNRVSVRTGFFSGRKVYGASPDAYNPPAIFWNYYPYLEKVDANCKVFEIPILASYHFGNTGRQHWFVSGGLSSLIMKQEDYHYTYKYTPTGDTYYRDWSVKNQNKHLFSVATISAGYQKNISKSITFTAEPYLKLPLEGVGYGKVKLKSTGVLFSFSIIPFHQKKNL